MHTQLSLMLFCLCVGCVSETLEIFASGHGVRPDFYQLANIRKCKYYAILESSVNSANDIVVSLAAVQAFLEQVL